MQDSKLKNIITNLFKEHLEAKILRLENRNIIETKDLKFITIEFEKLKLILNNSEKIAEAAFTKRATLEHSEHLNKSLKNVVNLSKISTATENKDRENNNKKNLARVQTEAHFFNIKKSEKKIDDLKDRMTPFNKKKINLDEAKSNTGNLTCRLTDEKLEPKTPKARRSAIDTLGKSKAEEINYAQITERLKVPGTAKQLTRNKTTAVLKTIKKSKEEDDENRKFDKNESQIDVINKAKKATENLKTIPETKNLMKHPTTKKIETSKKEKLELTKHQTEAIVKQNGKSHLNKNKEYKKDLDANFNKNNSQKNSIKLMNGKLDQSEIIVTDDYKTNKEMRNDLINIEEDKKKIGDTEKLILIENTLNKIKIEEITKKNCIEILKEMPQIKEEKKFKYFDFIKNEIIQNKILKFFNFKTDDKIIFKLNKRFFNFFIISAKVKLENEINTVQNKISNLKDKYKDEELAKEAPKFVMTRGAIKAVELLNDKMYLQIFKPDVVPQEEIVNIYRILLLYLNKREVAIIKNSNQFWSEACNLFLNESEGKIGNFINQYATNLNFSTENIFLISKIIGAELNKMTAPNFTKICATTGLVFFFIKDVLEYSGVIIDKKTPPIKIMNLYEYNLEYFTSRLERLKSKVEK